MVDQAVGQVGHRRPQPDSQPAGIHPAMHQTRQILKETASYDSFHAWAENNEGYSAKSIGHINIYVSFSVCNFKIFFFFPFVMLFIGTAVLFNDVHAAYKRKLKL